MRFAKKFKKTFHLTIWEAIIAITAVIVFFILEKIVYHDVEHAPTFLIVYGFIVGTWLAFRPSEWAVEGLNSGAKYVGLSEYVAGVLSSLASNLPEAVIAILLLVQGLQLVAVVTVLSAAGFNALILGIAILIATIKKKGKIAVPEDMEKREAPIIRWAIVALTMTVVFGFIEYFQVDQIEQAVLTRPVAGLLAASYLFYLIYIIVVKDNNKKMSLENHKDKEKVEETTEGKKKETDHESQEKLPVYLTIILLVLGFVGIYFGGETLTWCVTELMEGGGSGIGEIGLALILGAAGAVPEHGIAVISAAKDQIEVGIGNAMGGVLQSALLIFGILGIFVSITLHPFILLQIAAIAAALWFVKRCIHDKQFDTFEGIMIILLQILVFVILFEDIAFFA
jgi:calcium/proton exchanger cax